MSRELKQLSAAELIAIALQQQATIEAQQATIAQLEAENTQLRQRHRVPFRLNFGFLTEV